MRDNHYRAVAFLPAFFLARKPSSRLREGCIIVQKIRTSNVGE